MMVQGRKRFQVAGSKPISSMDAMLEPDTFNVGSLEVHDPKYDGIPSQKPRYGGYILIPPYLVT